MSGGARINSIDRRARIMELWNQGLSTPQIAARCGRTVKQISGLLSKAGIRSGGSRRVEPAADVGQGRSVRHKPEWIEHGREG